jgi:DNA invertase Pin-like site-specific DNA recombinase
MRVSTNQQKPDLQADGLRRYAQCAGLEIVAEYLDVAVSGRREGRPQLQALMRAAYNHAFACVLVWKFDRLAVYLSPADKYHRLTRRLLQRAKRPIREGSHGLPAAL